MCDLQQIEKKRRDRINSSLAELRQLVPAVMRRQVGQTADISETGMNLNYLRELMKYTDTSPQEQHSKVAENCNL